MDYYAAENGPLWMKIKFAGSIIYRVVLSGQGKEMDRPSSPGMANVPGLRVLPSSEIFEIPSGI